MDQFYPVLVNNMLRGKEFKYLWTGLNTDFPPILTQCREIGEDVGFFIIILKKPQSIVMPALDDCYL